MAVPAPSTFQVVYMLDIFTTVCLLAKTMMRIAFQGDLNGQLFAP